MEPMDAIDWLKSVEMKLQVVQCNNREKVLLVLTNFLVLQPTGRMLMSKPMRNLRASTGQNSELLSVHIMFPKESSS
jgi:hypothetical protein